MQAMLGGRLDQPSYCMLLRNLHPIYEALEDGLMQWTDHPSVAPIWTKRLSRISAIGADLNALHGPSWATDMEMVPASKDYALRLRSLCAHKPELLVAHAYVRYLGDLSGGQLLQRIVARSLALPNALGTGLSFYDFGASTEGAGLALAFRAGLNQVTQDLNCADAIVVEAVCAFSLHEDLFRQLATACNLQQTTLSLHP